MELHHRPVANVVVQVVFRQFLGLLTVGFLTALMVAGPKGPMVWKGSKRAPADGSTAANPFSMQDGAKSGQPDDKPAGDMACGAMMLEPAKPPSGTKSDRRWVKLIERPGARASGQLAGGTPALPG